MQYSIATYPNVSLFLPSARWLKVMLFCLLPVAFHIGAEPAEKALSMNALLQKIKAAQASASREQAARESRFKQQRQQQSQMLAQAKRALAAAESESSRLEAQFNANENKIAELKEQLDERLGSSKEMFGHLTAAATDTRAAIEHSIASAQYPGRTQFFDQLIAGMSEESHLPSVQEIRQLWYEMHRELTATGEVVKFDAPVTKLDGSQSPQPVVRLGVFDAVSDGGYLQYRADSNSLLMLPHQLAGTRQSAQQLLQSAGGDGANFVTAVVDPTGPTGGSLLDALVNKPGLVARWHQGGVIGYLITAVGVVALILALWRLFALLGLAKRVNHELTTRAGGDNPLGRVLSIGADHAALEPEALELKLHEQVLKERPAIESGLGALKMIAMVAPLMGLLGTVTGMIITFQAITNFGTGDPKTMAGGISAALVTTVLGLCVAIPTVLMHALVNGRAQRVLHILEEQSAGIVAQQVEHGRSSSQAGQSQQKSQKRTGSAIKQQVNMSASDIERE